ncbi:MAG: DNA polymerase III subunit [Patescibacteria group bacterium]|jgi:DNA polymerase-3 subunit delta'
MKSREFIGNQKVVEFLDRTISDQLFAHAYLFVGPGKLGKFKLASAFAKAALCQKGNTLKDINACGVCDSCQQFDKNVHSDFHLLQKEAEKKTISVGEIRVFQNNFYKTTLLSKRNVGIINSASELNIEGANALLKTLEEPPGKSIIILIAENVESLPSTVVSRCQIIQFSLVTKSKIRDLLQNSGCDKLKADTIASLAMGKPGLAIEYYEDQTKYERYLNDIQELLSLYGSSIPEKFAYVQQYLGSKKYQERIDNTTDLINYFSLIVHDCILIKNYLEKQVVNITALPALIKLSAKYSFAELVSQQKKLYLIREKFANSINPQLALENYFLTMKSNA